MHLLRTDNAIAIKGNITQKDDEPPKVIVSEIIELVDNSSFKDTKPIVESKPKVDDTPSSIPQKIYLRVNDMECREYKKALNLVDIFEGTVKVIFYNMQTKKYVAYSRGIDASKKVISELERILGKDNVVLK